MESAEDYEFRFWNGDEEIIVSEVDYIEFDGWDDSITGIEIDAGVLKNEYVPTKFGLSQNYPNPFNPSTTINYELPVDAKVTISVYNIVGQLVTELVNDSNVQKAGCHSILWKADNKPSGLYFVRMTSEDYSSTQKIVLLK